MIIRISGKIVILLNLMEIGTGYPVKPQLIFQIIISRFG